MLTLAKSETAIRDEALESAIRDLKRIGDELALNDYDRPAAMAYDAMVSAINARRPAVAQQMAAERLERIRAA